MSSTRKNRTKTIAKFQKNALEEIRISLAEYQGKDLIDIRIWLKQNDEAFVPTQKGVAIAKEKYPELKKALEILDQELKKIRG